MKSATLSLRSTLTPVAVAACLWTGAAAFAQAGPQAGIPDARPSVPPVPQARRPGAERPPAPRPPDEVAAPTASVNGRVARWLQNPNGDVDGLLLDDGTQIAFRPHLSDGLLESVKLKDSIQVTGRRGPTDKLIRATQIRTASGKVVADAASAPATPRAPREPAALVAMRADGRISNLLYTDRGDVNGVLLDSGTAVRFPPHVGTQLGAVLKTGGTLYAQGYGTRNDRGSAFEATSVGATAESAQAVFTPPHGPAGEPGARPPRGPAAPPTRAAGPDAPPSAPR